MALAVVGTRGMTYYGRKQTERLTAELVRAGFTVVRHGTRYDDGTSNRSRDGGVTLPCSEAGFEHLPTGT